ncbi:hypothetical protein ACSBR1_017428 [Camellia fascicularis]
MGGGFDGVSRVLETGLVRSDVLGRGNDGKHAPTGVAIHGCMGNGNIGACAKEGGPFQAINSQKTMINEIQTPNGAIGNLGLLRKLSGIECERTNLNLEVLLEEVQVGLEPSGSINKEGLNLGDSVAQPTRRPNMVQTIQKNLMRRVDVSRKGKEITVQKVQNTWEKGFVSKRGSKLAGGYSKQKGVVGSLGFQRGAIFRATATAVASSLSSSQS